MPKKLTRNVVPSKRTRFRSVSGEAKSTLRRDKGLRFEPLEPRLVLAGGLLVTEFMADNDGAWPDGDGNYEDWIEIHNPTAGAISLDGWYLTDDYADLTQWPFPDVTIDPGQYMVVFASSQPVDNYVDAGGYLHTSFALGKSGEYLGLVEMVGSTPTVVDEYNAGGTDFPAQYTDFSYGLSSDFTTEGYFVHDTPEAPSVEAPVDDPTRRIVITEIMYHPASENDLDEYIEISNQGNGAVSLDGWRFSDGVDFTFPSATLNVGEYLVVAADVATFLARYPLVTNVRGGWTGHLANGGESIELVDTLGGRIDRVTYADEGDWASRELGPLDYGHRGWQWVDLHDGSGRSLELVNLDLPNDYGQNWTASTPDGGTPGLPNSVAATDVAPLILDVTHFPVIPRVADPVTITAEVIDELATGVAVTLHYRVDTSTYDKNTYPTHEPLTYTSVTMLDDGASGDGAADDGVYGGQIPAQADGSVVEYYVEASDAGANSRTWPAPSDVDGTLEQVTNALYQVDNSYALDAEWTPGSKPTYRIIMTDAERARLADIGNGGDGEQNSDAQMNATFVNVDGTDTDVRYNAGVRNRGHGTRTGPPNNYRVNFANDKPWQNVTRININCRNTDSQLIGMVMYQMAGLPATDAVGVQVLVNGTDLSENYSRMYGTYVSLEAPDGDFTEHHFPNDGEGNLYKGLRLDSYAQEADFRYEGTDPNAYRDTYFKMTNDDVDDWSDLIHMTDVLNNTPDETYLADISTVINVDQWLNWLALDALLLNRETGLSRGIGDDYMMYSGVNDPRFVLIPHDLDSLMQLSGSGSTGQSIFVAADGVDGSNGVEALDRMLHHPDVTPLYYQAFLDLIETFFNHTVLDPIIDQALGSFAPAGTLSSIKSYIDARTAGVLAQIPQEFTINSTLPVVDGYRLSSSSVAAITGTADVSETYLVRVNGVDVEWSPREGTWAFGQGGIGATVLSFQDDVSPDGTYAGTVDTEIRASAPTADLSTVDSINVDDDDPSGSGQDVQGLIRFDDVFGTGPGQVAPTDPIATATLTLYVSDSGANMSLHRMLNTWVEASNWNTFGGNGVQADGVEAVAASDGSLSGSSGKVTINVTDAILAWQADPASNHGWVLLPGGSDGVDFDSREGAAAANHPELKITLDDGTPSVGGVPLEPGVNRIVVETFDNREGTGEPLETGHIDVWYDATQVENIISPGNVSGEWSPINGYYHVTGNITVPAGSTLTIQPGTNVYFDPGANLTVNGRLLAQGLEDQRITLTRFGVSGAWGGIAFSYGSYSDQVNYITYTDFDYSDSAGDAIDISNAQLVLDNVTFDHHGSSYYLDIHSSSFIVSNSTFPDLGSGELIHGTGFPANGYALFEGNWFGRANGYNDVIDFTGGQRPGPILRIMNNYFSGGGDDGLDLDSTDTHIEGNVFVDFHQDGSRASKAHAIATGNDLNQDTEVTIVRNLFYDVDHAILIKDGAFGTIVNNTIVKVYKKFTSTDATTAAINLAEDRDPQYEGNGVYIDGNIFYDVSNLFGYAMPVLNPMAVTMNNSIVYPATTGEFVPWVGANNQIDVDPLLMDSTPTDITGAGLRAAFALQPGSPAIGAGPNGQDVGGLIPAGATIDGEPPANTTDTFATLTVGGPHICAHKYRVNAGAWSSEQGVLQTVESITRVGSIATVTITGHGYANGDVVDIYGPKEQEYNGTFTIANVTASTFDVTVTGTPNTPATGTIIARRQEPIELTGLTSGDYMVEVIAQDSAGIWQDEAEATMSETWTVDAGIGAPPAGVDSSVTDPDPPPVVAMQTDIPGGTITVNTTWTAAAGPYTITGNVVVDSGVTLTIEPSTTLFFQDGVSLTINGTLVAEGTQYEQIRFTHVPGGGSWEGLQFLNTTTDNRVSWAVFEYATTDAGMIGVENSNLTLDHVTLDHAERRRIRTQNSSLIVRNSTFTDMFPTLGQAPLTDNGSEQIWGAAPVTGHFIIENNVFGVTKGHNDVIDVDGHTAPNTVMQYLGNTFLGGGDDALDLEGDALIEGNTFMHFRKDQWNTSAGNANVVSAGAGHDFTFVRNMVYDVDHVTQVKDNAFMTLVDNTIVDVDISAMYFWRSGVTPGRGAYVEGNVFADTPMVFDSVQTDPATDLTAHRNIMPEAFHIYGTGNLDEDPRLADPAGGDLSLKLGSPALGTGPNGLDMGAMVPAGASISGEPEDVTTQTNATLTVAGPGISLYQYRLNGDPWSAETVVATPISLTGLVDDDYTVEVIGKNFAGLWQAEADATASKTWTVDSSSLPLRLRINEVLAINTAAVDHEGTFPDLVELYNAGPDAVDLAGMSLSDNAATPTKYVFPTDAPGETTIAAGGYLRLYADSETTTSGLHLGFALDGDGEGVFLYDTVGNGGTLLDSVEFGMQVADLSIGRVGHAAAWALTQPTLGTANLAARTGDPATFKINEWFTDGDVRLVDDFIELYSADPLPVPLGGLHLTDRPYLTGELVSLPDGREIAPLSFGSGFAVFKADSNTAAGPSHVDFKLSPNQEMIGLFDADLNQIDKIIYFPQTTDYSQGRAPDGGDTYDFFRLPTPGMDNDVIVTVNVGSMDIDHVWSYDQSGSDLGTEWREPTYVENPVWSTGAAPLGYPVDDPIPLDCNTPLALGPITYYFRTTFTVNADPADVTLTMTTLLDDGAIFYLNGEKAYSIGIPDDPGDPPVDYLTEANRTVDDANYERPFTLPTDDLLQGTNLLAVEVHQTDPGSSDIIFGMTLDATIAAPPNPILANASKLLDALRITEMMYYPGGDGDLEFVEFQNVGTETLDLTGVRVRDAIDFTFPPMLLAPQQFVVIVRDLDKFQLHYGPGINVAGEYSGNLSNGGEDLLLELASPLDVGVLRFEYDDAWYPTTDGGGYALEVANTGAKAADWGKLSNWQAGSVVDGTPGTDDGLHVPDVVVNEVLSHTDNPLVDAIELHNTTGGDIDVGGWYLSDSTTDFVKFEIPADAIIPAGGYVTFYEGHYVGETLEFDQATEFGGTGLKDFALNGAHGDDVWLVEADTSGKVTRFVDYTEFGAAAAGESWGRWPNGEGHLYPMTQRTFDDANSGPRLGELIFSEVYYNSGEVTDPENLEFIEIYNTTLSPVTLTNWRLRKGIDFDFIAGTTIASHEALVILPFDPQAPADAGLWSAFCTAYGLKVLEKDGFTGPYTGQLSNGGDRAQLQRPDSPPDDEPGYYPGLLEDEVIYDDAGLWPSAADGSGDSLNRLSTAVWGNEPTNWNADTTTPGTASVTAAAYVAGRYIFYNDSTFETSDPDPFVADYGAIAPDKTALLPGQTATFANYTSYSRGINGIMVDIAVPDEVPTESHFEFYVGNTDDPAGWTTEAPAPITVEVRSGVGQGGSDRVTILWDDYAIRNEWLQVTVLGTNLGLPSNDVFCFGNAVGESGNSATDARVTTTDLLLARNNPRNVINQAAINFAYDYDRDARINSTDVLLARNNQTNFLTALKLITVPSEPAASLAASPADLAWLLDYDLQSTGSHSAKKDDSTKAVDEVLATLWQ